MKKILTSFFVALLCFSTIGLCQPAATEPELDFDAAAKAFDQLLGEFKTNLTASDAQAKAVGGKFAIVGSHSVPHVGGGAVATFSGVNTTAVRVWFELTDGRYVDPRFYRWAPGEMFYVHVQSATPVYVALYQNFPRGGSRQVYPDPRYPHSYQIMAPGVDTRLPVLFRTDMNFAPEHMSIVVSRADWSGIQPYVPQATTTAINAYGTAYAQATSPGAYVQATPGGATATAIGADGSVATATVTDGIWKSAAIQDILKGSELRSDEAFAKFAIVNTAGLNNTEYVMSPTAKYFVRCRVAYPRLVRPAYYVSYRLNRPNYVSITNVNIANISYNSPYVMRGCYHDFSDVAFYLFADHGVGQMQITFNKINSGWRWAY